MKTDQSEKNKKSEGRISKIKPDIYERVKRDAKYKKMSVDQYLDVLLRKELFQDKKRPQAGKKDFLGYCPNCSAKVKHSTLKPEPRTEEAVLPDSGSGDSFIHRLFGKKSGLNQK